jgi:cytochrome c oxidase subunit 2
MGMTEDAASRPHSAASRPRSAARWLLVQPLVAAAALIVAAFAPPAAFAGNGGFAPVSPESSNAHDIRTSYLFISIFTLVVFVAVEALLVIFIFRFRRRRRDPRFREGPEMHGATRLELMWTAIPVVILFLIASFIFVKLPGISNVPSAGAAGEELRVKVTGRQFYWQFEYPNGVITIDNLRAPVSEPVRLDVTAPAWDVIHSWWVPALAGKMDAIPGLTNTTWFRADRAGIFRGQCAELCGLEHARMLATVEAMPKDAFDAWLDKRSSDQASGASDLGVEEWAGVCAKCHGLAGEGGIGPRLAGSAALADRQGLVKLIRNGRGRMPAVARGWIDEQVSALTTYLKEHPPSGS